MAMAGPITSHTLKKSLSQIPKTSLTCTLLLTAWINISVFSILTISSASSHTTNASMTHTSHHRHRPGSGNNSNISMRMSHSGATPHSSMTFNATPIGLPCQHDDECANFSVCQDKTFPDNLVLKVCQCDPAHMNRVGDSCFVQPGHQCYFPDHQHKLLRCMPETECRSGLNRTLPGAAKSGYCFCKDTRDDEPFRVFSVKTEIRRCGAEIIFSGMSQMVMVVWGVFVYLV